MVIFKSSKISHRLTIIYALLFFVAIALVNVATLFSIDYYINRTSVQQLQLVDQTILNEVKTLKDIPKINLREISQVSENIDISLLYHNRVIYNTGEYYHLPVPDGITDHRIVTAEAAENEVIYLNDTLTLSDGEKMGIQVIKDMVDEQVYFQALSGIMLLIDAIILVISILVGYIVSKNALSPIDRITSQAKDISASNLAARIQIDGPDDELKRLADTFNDLIARIQYSYDKQNRFTLDASHELATPLAVIKGYIDLLDRWGKDDREVLKEGIEAIKVELANMTRLLDTLLFIAKSDHEIYKLEQNRFWLNSLIGEVIRESRLLDAKHEILCLTDLHLEMEGDRRLIKEMLRAIIDNSLKYSGDNARVEIDYMVKDGKVVIEIADHGIGIPPEDLPHIFDRFYRVDKSRSRSIGGMGLGLSIVKWIVDIHLGTIAAESKLGEGTRIFLKLPIG